MTFCHFNNINSSFSCAFVTYCLPLENKSPKVDFNNLKLGMFCLRTNFLTFKNLCYVLHKRFHSLVINKL